MNTIDDNQDTKLGITDVHATLPTPAAWHPFRRTWAPIPMGSGTPTDVDGGPSAALKKTAPQVGSVAGWARVAPVGASDARMVVTDMRSPTRRRAPW